MPMLRAADLHELRLAHETANMIMSAEMKLRASIMRKESRCSHFRLDYPDMDTKNWNAWINIYKGGDGKMKLEKQPFDKWRYNFLELQKTYAGKQFYLKPDKKNEMTILFRKVNRGSQCHPHTQKNAL